MKHLIPTALWRPLQPVYHWMMALVGAVVYRFPSRRLTVIGVTGTKGKSTVTELINAILEEAGHTTALAGTVRFKIGATTEPNLKKMTMPGRFFLQKFLRRAVRAGCDVAVLEMTSEGAKQFRHKWIDLNALIFTNLSPEHIESHGSFEKYREAKLGLARALARSPKFPKYIVVNADDPEHARFLAEAEENSSPVMFSLENAAPYSINPDGITFSFEGTRITSPLVGVFNLSNILAALSYARSRGISMDTAKRAIEAYTGTPGRVERIDEGQAFTVIVDYAHTPDSLEQLYGAFETTAKVCVLGNAGGGRDTWKRPEMGRIADEHCNHIILTNEDPYDEDPRAIVEQMKEGIKETETEITMDRREAIRSALEKASALASTTEDGQKKESITVLITGKGTDPYIMGPNGSKEPWNDAEVAREELKKLQR